ncbi:DUF2336 domain-containing protein [Phenylobacterium sp. NIBR 498073]|uniref:DUF2336 domain-containing protein n=1 Tax=Phenylobacterium sp. NIBR 498073 TaxID=3015177 RepID=UPI0022B4FA90|nr:DUF2336 domain-containing protein [Phenylobacterium sp. NIBR 498073]WGU41439.1 DUF2336 domain-containing protein [Phenylobacterium sp. NIBR 498073]
MNLPTPMTELDAPPASRARANLLKRLADVVCLPLSRINAFERAMTADLLADMLREAEPAERKKVAHRISGLAEIPATLARLLLRDEVDVAEELLLNAATLSDADLLDCARLMNLEHRRLIALRRGVSEVVCDVLIEFGEVLVLECLLKNDEAKLSTGGIEAVVALTRGDPRLTSMLLRRPELRPAHAYVLFWWADAEARRAILQRFAVSREVLQEATSDIFAMAAAEHWQEPLSRKALQFIERRQRNRAAVDRSPYDNLEAAVAAAADGLSREVAEEISYLSGLKPMTGAKIFTDSGGEPLAILCKATGLPKSAIRALWRGLKREETEADGSPSGALERAILVYDMIAVDRAQTVLRYWNWSLTSALTPALLRAIRDGDEDGFDEYSAPQKAAMLAFSKDFGR